MSGGIVGIPSTTLDQVQPAALTAALDGRWADLRREVRTQLAGADGRDRSDLSTEEYRRQILEDLRLLAKTGHSRLGFAREYGGRTTRPGRWSRTRCSASATCR
jgi:hypothetical protein